MLWSADVSKLDMTKDAPYIIHQVLSHGTLDHIAWLFRAYSKEYVQKVFMSYPYKDYTARRFSFITNFLLKIPNEHLDSRRYVKHIPRAIRRG